MSLLPQFGFFELVLVAIIALVVVGPRDLPKLMRTVGRMAAQARRMAGEFRSAFDQMSREAEMEEMRKEIEALKHDNVVAEAKRSIEDAVKPVEDAVREEAGEMRDAMTAPAPQSDDAEQADAKPATSSAERAE